MEKVRVLLLHSKGYSHGVGDWYNQRALRDQSPPNRILQMGRLVPGNGKRVTKVKQQLKLVTNRTTGLEDKCTAAFPSASHFN